MTVSGDIVRSWRRPRAVIREKLTGGVREERALAVLIGACGLIFVAQWPALARAAHLDPETPLDARLAGALFGVIFLLPPLCYALAGLSHLIARALGGKGSFFGARLALFWALLAVAPLMLVQGIARGFLTGMPALLLGLAIVAGFVWLWGNMLIEAET